MSDGKEVISSGAAVDQTGTKPGLATSTKPEKVLNLKCPAHGCKSLTAFEITVVNPNARVASHARTYQCTKCNTTWSLQVGGHIDI